MRAARARHCRTASHASNITTTVFALQMAPKEPPKPESGCAYLSPHSQLTGHNRAHDAGQHATASAALGHGRGRRRGCTAQGRRVRRLLSVVGTESSREQTCSQQLYAVPCTC